jgi:hypothetical protein
MMIEITEQQSDLLLELLNREIDELGPEIHHTTRVAFRHELEDKRRLLVELRDRLMGVSANAHVGTI